MALSPFLPPLLPNSPPPRLQTAQEELDKVMSQLKEKQDMLASIEAKVGWLFHLAFAWAFRLYSSCYARAAEWIDIGNRAKIECMHVCCNSEVDTVI